MIKPSNAVDTPLMFADDLYKHWERLRGLYAAIHGINDNAASSFYLDGVLRLAADVEEEADRLTERYDRLRVGAGDKTMAN